MIIISHRGNINGRNLKRENNPKYIQELLDLKIPCEIDIWYTSGLWLGHDKPQYKISNQFLITNREKLFIHCKNRLALDYFNSRLDIINLNYFWNDKDKYSLTSQKQVWTNIGEKVCRNSILVDLRPNPWYDAPCWGICVDYIK